MKRTLSMTIDRSMGETDDERYTELADAFGYNERGEVVFSRRDEYPQSEASPQSGCPSRGENAEEDEYSYDNIGNQTLFAESALTNAYTHNALNQIETSQIISALSASPREKSSPVGNWFSAAADCSGDTLLALSKFQP